MPSDRTASAAPTDPTDAPYQTVRYEVDGGVATVTLNRPEALNGIINTMMREVHEVLREAAADDDVRVVVLTGAGKGFCPGADLKHYTTPGAVHEPLRREYFHLTTLLHEMRPVTIAAVNGACAGAGFGWACACDLRVAAASANFSTAFLNVAVAGDMGGPWTLPRIVGPAKARELYFLPEKFGAEEALRIGLVSRVWPDDQFRAEARALADRLAAAAPLALQGMKAHFVAAEKLGFADFLDLETTDHERITASEDCGEAFRAFVEKRPPQFKGR
ncbi:MAG: enoyl-CoA hydratase-related protein [Acidimicrobiales bacterium]